MKYLYLLIRHCFPRSRWTEVERADIVASNGSVVGLIILLKDQFGNLKKFTIR